MSRAITRHRQAGIEFSNCQPVKPQGTLICLHGIGGDDRSFLPQSISLSEQVRVLSWNMPGYGQSTALENVTFEALAKSLRLLSIGGMVAQEFVHRYPEQVRSLILIATTPAFGGRDDSFKDAFLAARLKPLNNGMTMQELAAETVPQITGTTVSDSAMNAAIASMANVKEATYRDTLKCLITFNRREELTNIRSPVCVISGSEDQNAPAVTMKKMAEKLLNSEYHEIAGAGHLTNLERPDECNQIVRHFLESQLTS